LNIRTVGRPDAEYPPLLREIPDSPARLHLAGLPLEPGPALAIVGSRRTTPYGIEVAGWLASGLASAGVAIISGLASGIDAAAHWGALSVGGTTVAVLGCGLDICYPRANRALYRRVLEEGTLVSEHEPGTRPLPHHFPVRNRIIAGMSSGVVIVEARPGGGAMITARLAMEFGREVMAVPGPVHSLVSQGPHSLLREGARVVTSPQDILADLGMEPCPAGPEQEPEQLCLRPDERTVMEGLDANPALLDLVARKVRMPVSTVSAILVGLELKGAVTRMPGGRFARSVKG
jgi:DNA processing protein